MQLFSVLFILFFMFSLCLFCFPQTSLAELADSQFLLYFLIFSFFKLLLFFPDLSDRAGSQFLSSTMVHIALFGSLTPPAPPSPNPLPPSLPLPNRTVCPLASALPLPVLLPLASVCTSLPLAFLKQSNRFLSTGSSNNAGRAQGLEEHTQIIPNPIVRLCCWSGGTSSWPQQLLMLLSRGCLDVGILDGSLGACWLCHCRTSQGARGNARSQDKFSRIIKDMRGAKLGVFSCSHQHVVTPWWDMISCGGF